MYRFPEEAASAMGALARYRRCATAPVGQGGPLPRRREARAPRDRGGAEGADGPTSPPAEVRECSRPTASRSRLRGAPETAAEAIAAAMELGYPVVLKVESDRISHKTDVEGVKLDLRNADEVAAAFRDLTTRLRKLDPKLRVLVQRFVTGGREVILGMTRDAQFGPVLMFGLGGVFVEVLQDVSTRIHPLTDVGARAMIERVKGYPLLAGHRGEKPVAHPVDRGVAAAAVAARLRLRVRPSRDRPQPVHRDRSRGPLVRRRRAHRAHPA